MKTATTHSTAAETILAIDLGRYKSVACVYDSATASGRFHRLDTNRIDLGRLFQSHPSALVVVEACANAGWVHDLAGEHGLSVRVANTTAEAWKFQHLKRKTDRDDALRLAELTALGQLPTVTLPDLATRQRRGLIAHRQALLGRRVAAQNRIRGLFASQGLAIPRGHRAWSESGLAGLDSQARPLAECGAAELWRGMLHLALADYRHLLGLIAECEAGLDRLAAADPATQLLRTVPGVGRADGRGRRRPPARPQAVRLRQAGRRLRRLDAPAVPVRRNRPQGPDQPPRLVGAAQAVGRVRLVHAPVQPLGAGHFRPPQPRWRQS